MLEGAGSQLRWWETFSETDLQPENDTPSNKTDNKKLPVIALHSPFMNPRMMLASVGKAAFLADRHGQLKNIAPNSTPAEEVMTTAILHGYPESAAELARRIEKPELESIKANFYRKHRSEHFWQGNNNLAIPWARKKPDKLTPGVAGNLIAYDKIARDNFFAEASQAKTVTGHFLKVLANAIINQMTYVPGPWDATVTAHILNNKIFKDFKIPKNLDEKHILAYADELPPEIFSKQTVSYWEHTKKGALLALNHRYKPANYSSPLLNSCNLQASLNNYPKWYHQVLHGYHLAQEMGEAPTPEQAWDALAQNCAAPQYAEYLHKECRQFEQLFPAEAASDWYTQYNIYRTSTLI